jgi:hypothetical protein
MGEGKGSTGDSGRATVVRFFVGGRWDPAFASGQKAVVGIKVEHGAKKGIFGLGLLSLAGIELGPNSADPKENAKISPEIFKILLGECPCIATEPYNNTITYLHMCCIVIVMCPCVTTEVKSLYQTLIQMNLP